MKASRFFVGAIVFIFYILIAGTSYAQEPTPTPRPTLTPIPTSTPVYFEEQSPTIDTSNPADVLAGITRGLQQAIDVVQKFQDTIGSGLTGMADGLGNDFCLIIGVLYGGEGIIGSYLTTMLIGSIAVMAIGSVARFGLWAGKYIFEFFKVL